MKIKSFSYRKGIKLPGLYKQKKEELKCINIDAPKRVYISVKQVRGPLPVVSVAVNDVVKIGSVVAVNGDNKVFSSVSGVVEKVVQMQSVYGDYCSTVVIKNDFKDEKLDSLNPVNTELDDEVFLQNIKELIKEHNIVDYDGFSLYSKLTDQSNAKTIKQLVINAVTDEPYTTNNLILFRDKLEEISLGAEILAKLFNTSLVRFAVTKGFGKQVQSFTTAIGSGNGIKYEIAKFPDLYPVGDEREMYKAITKRELKLGLSSRTKGIAIIDLYTVYNLGVLLKTGVCDIDRLLTVWIKTRKGAESFNAWVRVGTKIADLISSVSPDKFNGIHKLVAGGPMRGIALGSENVPIVKGLKSVLLFTDRIQDEPKETSCISCNKCIDVCPRGLNPKEIERHVINGDYVKAKKLGATYCSKCGCCSYVCPAKRYLVQRVSYARDTIREKGI